MPLPKKIKTDLDITYDKTLLERREELLDNITKNGTYLPKSLLHDDLDRGMLDFVKNDLQITSQGKIIQTLDRIVSTQNWSQYTETWTFIDEDNNPLPPFVTLVRMNDTKYGSNPATLYTIPNRKPFYFASVPTWDGQRNGMDIYSIPQPVPIDINFSIKIITNRIRDLNKFNTKVLQKFSSRQSYATINGHYIPIILTNIQDESQINTDSRKFYIQSYDFIMLGFLIDEEEFQIKPAINRISQVFETELGNQVPSVNVVETIPINDLAFELIIDPTPTPTNTPTVTPTNSITPTQTITPTNTITPTQTITPSQTQTPTNTVTPTQTITPTNTPTITPTNTITPTPTITPTNTITPTQTITPTNTITPTQTQTPTNTVTPTQTITPSPTTLFDADAQAFFDRVTAAGGTLTTTEQNAVNTLVVQMKADGIWTKMKAIYPMVGASAAACAQNLKSSSFTGTFSSGATFTSDGYNPNGASFMNTQLIPLNDLQLNSTHLSQYFKVYNINAFAGIGCADDVYFTKSLYAYWNYTNEGGIFRVNSNSNIYNSPRPNTFTKGLGIISRTASNSTIFYDRTFAYANSTTISTGLSSFPISVSGRNIAGNTSGRTTNIISFTTIGDGLTNTDALNLNTSVEAFQTTLSRQAI